MSRTSHKASCLIKSKKGETKIFLLEDFHQISSIKKARELTDSIYIRNDQIIQKYKYGEYPIYWAWYDLIYDQMIKYLEVKPLLEKIRSTDPREIYLNNFPAEYSKIFELYFFDVEILPKRKVERFNEIKKFIGNLFFALFSLLSILVIQIKRTSNNIGIRTEDLILKGTKSDFRLNNLYSKFDQNNVSYLEFVRIKSFTQSFRNIFIRRRVAIYYTTISYFIKILNFQKNREITPENFHQALFETFRQETVILQKSIGLMAKILKLGHIKKFILISFSSRSAVLSFAAKELDIKTIGIMHGLQQKEYAVYEFMESYNGPKIGCDYYSVWSNHYLDYFRNFSKVHVIDGIENGGLLRPFKGYSKGDFKRVCTNKIKALLIIEPLINQNEIAPYIKSLLIHPDIDLSIKLRPMIKDKAFESLKIILPETSDLKTYDGRISSIANDFDVFIGSNSTAVIEAAIYNKISILVYTKKFADYFEINHLIDGKKLLIEDPEEIYQKIIFRIKNENQLKTIPRTMHKFFGSLIDGNDWILEKIK